MGYPARLLSDDEVIETQFRPHWSRILREGLIVLVGIAIAVALAIWVEPPAWVYGVVAVLVIVLIARGFVRWVNTLHVITNERLIYRTGFIAKQGSEIPLEVIQDVAFNQTLFERIFGTGDLMIESAGTRGQTRYQDIPGPEQVQSLIYRVREARMFEIESAESTRPAPGDDSLSRLERLSQLHDDGKLTDEEFAAQKSKLIGGAT
jgi:uncharacterized membrane protein YdbT with pleckstrin-like domain